MLRARDSSIDRLQRDSGTSPRRWLLARDSAVSDARSPIEAGRLPVSSLWERSRLDSRCRRPRLSGRRPAVVET